MSAPTLNCAFTGTLGQFSLDVAFDIPLQGFTALSGPSGSGKTTVLRCIAGLERLPGRLTAAGETWQDGETFLPAWKRPVGYVFQEASLLEHLSVHGNLAYAAKRSGAQPSEIDDLVRRLGLDALLSRATGRLSGGERQRVAIARALVTRPRLLLMDEPMAGLDREAKAEILPYLEELANGALPILYVSHDEAEVARLANRVIGIRAGKLTGV